MHLGRPTIRVIEGATLDDSDSDDDVQSPQVTSTKNSKDNASTSATEVGQKGRGFTVRSILTSISGFSVACFKQIAFTLSSILLKKTPESKI